MKPFIRVHPDLKNSTAVKLQYYKENPTEEMWGNDLYQVNVRRGIVPDDSDQYSMCHLSIKRLDKGANMDWRHMQQIKNIMVGEQNEGMEMFPAESRLVDGANQFHLWVFEDATVRWPWGFNTRLVTEDESIGNVQRKFDTPPADLEECTAQLKKAYKKYAEKSNGR